VPSSATTEARKPPYLLLFDGICRLCDQSVQFILRHDQQQRICFCSIQSPAGRQWYQQLGLNPDQPETMVLIGPQGAYRKSDAALEIANLLGGVWRLAILFKIIPRPLRDAAYLLIARHRYRWFGRHSQCPLPQPEWHDRFVC
jgi:predicted DCC family thiol-disulfide oxidoreductase YuxK